MQTADLPCESRKEVSASAGYMSGACIEMLDVWRVVDLFVKYASATTLAVHSRHESHINAFQIRYVHREANASTVPVPSKATLLRTATSTGYFHSMNLVQPKIPFKH